MTMVFFSMLMWLIVGHAVADFPLQGDFLAAGKNRHGPLARTVPWWICLSAHAAIHAGAVALVTGSMILGTIELCIHWSIDFAKCEGWLGRSNSRSSFTVDQALHMACKIAYAAVLAFGTPI